MGTPQNSLGPPGILWDPLKGSQGRNLSRSSTGKLLGIMVQVWANWIRYRKKYAWKGVANQLQSSCATLAMSQSLKTFQYPSFSSVGAGEYLVNCSFRNFWQVDCSDRLTKARAASQADHRNIGNNSWLAKILSGLVSWPFPWGGLGEFRCSSRYVCWWGWGKIFTQP